MPHEVKGMHKASRVMLIIYQQIYQATWLSEILHLPPFGFNLPRSIDTHIRIASVTRLPRDMIPLL